MKNRMKTKRILTAAATLWLLCFHQPVSAASVVVSAPVTGTETVSSDGGMGALLLAGILLATCLLGLFFPRRRSMRSELDGGEKPKKERVYNTARTCYNEKNTAHRQGGEEDSHGNKNSGCG